MFKLGGKEWLILGGSCALLFGGALVLGRYEGRSNYTPRQSYVKNVGGDDKPDVIIKTDVRSFVFVQTNDGVYVPLSEYQKAERDSVLAKVDKITGWNAPEKK